MLNKIRNGIKEYVATAFDSAGVRRAIRLKPEPEIVLSFKVIGAHFPARDVVGNTSFFRVTSTTGVDNKIYFDFGDNTGWHEFALKAGTGANAGVRQLDFTARSNQTTTNGLPGTSIYDQNPIYFYQDLPVGVKNTVNDFYLLPGANPERTIKLRFQKPQNITGIYFSRVRLYGEFPGDIARLRALRVLFLFVVKFLTSFPVTFYATLLRSLTIANIGTAVDLFENWILNSPLEDLGAETGINLTEPGPFDANGNPISYTKQLNQIWRLKESMSVLNLRGININYPLPESMGELFKMTQFVLGSSNNPALRLPSAAAISGTNAPVNANPNFYGWRALNNAVLSSTRMPFVEIEKLVKNSPLLASLDIRQCEYSVDYQFSNVAGNPYFNTVVTSLLAGGQSWGYTIPSFVNRFSSLLTLDFVVNFGTAASSCIKFYGNFSNCFQLFNLYVTNNYEIETTFPSWLPPSIKRHTVAGCFRTVARLEEYINNLYAEVTAVASMVPGNTNRRQMTIDTCGTGTTFTASAAMPGTFQAPAGYQKQVMSGSTVITPGNNGAPANALEKVFVLFDQYAVSVVYK